MSTGPFYRNVTLPDEVLLEIFALYGGLYRKKNWWFKLVHVCRKWRQVVFASPRRLNLQLLCTQFTPARKMLDVWPDLPLVISHDNTACSSPELADNVIAALERTNRVFEIMIYGVPSSLVERFAAAMQEPFPALTYLAFSSHGSSKPVLPSSFLGGCAPLLEYLEVENIPIALFQKLPSCSPSPVTLSLTNNLYIPPGVIVDCLSGLTRLETFSLIFHSPRSRPDQTSLRPPMLARVVLPSLTSFLFNGVSEYFEDLTARIDTPKLNKLSVSFFNQLIFAIPQLTQFISRIGKFTALDRAEVYFGHHSVTITLKVDEETYQNGFLSLSISCTPLDWQVSALEQVCSSTLQSLPNLKSLHIWHDDRLTDGVENTQWPELLRPFTTLETLIVPKYSIPFVERILGALAGEGVTEAMRTLEWIDIALGPLESIPEGIEKFVTARQLSGRPVAVERKWEPVVDRTLVLPPMRELFSISDVYRLRTF
ncbi:hypothetical protein F5148DRAFT_1279535 [Russula earlei]|uniref:Uncharacterized protein n=1 Tax=Russula earlei TaxID=71964 RepID=A0ACC0UM24_9AGAM|nr:hypothetical protein F5148DRAFT_1279535 [Russula earlei]